MERYEVYFNSTAGIDYVRDTQAGKILSVGEIVRLLTERDALRAALRPFTDVLSTRGYENAPDDYEIDCDWRDGKQYVLTAGDYRVARALVQDKAGTVKEVQGEG